MNGNVYVSDAEKCNIQKFDSEGNFISMWGSKGEGPGQFLQPESMAIDSNGNIFVADYANQQIQKFDSEGNFITMWGSKGRGIVNSLNLGELLWIQMIMCIQVIRIILKFKNLPMMGSF